MVPFSDCVLCDSHATVLTRDAQVYENKLIYLGASSIIL